MSMKKRTASLMLAVLAVVSLIQPVLAADDGIFDEVLEEIPAETPEIEEEDSTILLDGEPVPAVEYEMRSGVCYVTVSSFVSMLDAEAMVEEEDGAVSVNASTVTQIVEADAEEAENIVNVLTADLTENIANVLTADLTLTAAVGAAYFVANGRYLYVGGGIAWVNGRVAVPVRQLARVFNLSVDYDAGTQQVLLAHQENAEPYLASGEDVYDSEILLWLSRIINAESGNQPLEGKIAVGNVVMNRLNDPLFPNTLYDVLFQKNQFSPASSGSIYKEPNWESQLAAMLVLDGAQVVPEALFFNGAGAKGYAYKNRSYVTTIGNHDFYK